MKKLILASLLGTSALFAFAQTAPDTVTVPGHALRIDAPTSIRHMDKDEFYRFKGAYDLSNGQTLSLTRGATRMYAEIDDQGKHEIVATGQGEFVALDRQLKMTLEPQDDNDMRGELLMMVPAKAMADGTLGQPQLLVASFR